MSIQDLAYGYDLRAETVSGRNVAFEVLKNRESKEETLYSYCCYKHYYFI